MEVNPKIKAMNSASTLQRVAPLLTIGSLPLLFAPTFADLGHHWAKWTESLSHGYLLIAIFIVLYYRATPFQISPNSRIQAIAIGALLFFAAISWSLFSLVHVEVLAELAVLACSFLAFAFIFGVNTAWQHRFLLALPIFAFTLWDQLNSPLVWLSSLVVGNLISLVDIPAVIDGSSIFIPYGHIVIADGCSGLRYFTIALAMGYLISYLNGYSEKGFFKNLFIAATLALITNWLRIFILILIGYFTEMKSSLMNDHEMFGWLLFAAICFPALYFSPVVQRANDIATSEAKLPIRNLALATLLMASGPIIYWLSAPSSNSAALLIETPAKALQIAKPTSDQHLVLQANAITPAFQQYFVIDLHEQAPIYLTINNYLRKDKSQEFIPYINNLIDNATWQQISVALENLPVADTASILKNKNGTTRFAQIQWFQIGDYTTQNIINAKLLQIAVLLSKNKQFRIITLRRKCHNEACSEELERLKTTAQALYNTINNRDS